MILKYSYNLYNKAYESSSSLIHIFVHMYVYVHMYAAAITCFKENIVNYLRKLLLGKMYIWEVARFGKGLWESAKHYAGHYN